MEPHWHPQWRDPEGAIAGGGVGFGDGGYSGDAAAWIVHVMFDTHKS